MKLDYLRTSRFFVYSSVFSILVVLPSTFFPFIGGKYYFFRFAVELALVFAILWWAFDAREGEAERMLAETARKPLFIAVSVFVLMFLLAALFAHDVRGAFWSNFERGEGAFQMLHYYVFFGLLMLFFRSWKEWRLIFVVSLIAALGMIAYGVAAQLNLVGGLISPYQSGTAPATKIGQLTSARFQATLGNPAYVAPYLIFSIFYAAVLWVTHTWKNRRAQAVLCMSLIAVFLFFFVLTQTRGSFLGLMVAVFALLAYVTVKSSSLRKIGISILVGLMILVGTAYFFRSTPFVRAIPGSRFLELSVTDQTVKTRVWTWNSAWKGFLERPILGWGPENFSAVFDLHFDPRHFIPGTNSETWFDRGHSVIFDYLAETGILGFGSYVAMFITLYWLLFRRSHLYRATSDRVIQFLPLGAQRHALLRGLVLSLPVAYLVQGLALFDVLPIYINVFLFLAFASFYSESVQGDKNINSHK